MKAVVRVGAIAALVWSMPALAEPYDIRAIAATVERGNPRIEAQRHVVEALKARLRAARNGYLPSVRATLQAQRRNLNIVNANGDQTFDIGQADVSISQPLYDGGRTLHAIRIARAQLAGGEAELNRVIGETLLDLLSAAAELQGRIAIKTYTLRQQRGIRKEVASVERQLKLGEATLTDLDQAKARLASSDAAYLGASLDVATSWSRLAAISGTTADEPLLLPTLPETPATYDDALAVAESTSPELQYAKISAEAGESGVSAARAELMPTVTAIAGYQYLSGGVPDLFAGKLPRDRAAIYGGISVNIPIFQQGKEYAEIRRARSVEEQQHSLLEQTRREVSRDVITAWHRCKASVEITEAAARAVLANILTVKGIEREAALGSRTTTDVLDAQRDLLTARVAEQRALVSEYIARATLLVAIGILNAASLGAPLPVPQTTDGTESPF